jgi:hypothetical protein
MASRFVVRRQDNGEYCVWDNKADAVAQTENSQICHESLEYLGLGNAQGRLVALDYSARALFDGES